MGLGSFDVDAAHEHFSVVCFNETWALLDRNDRSSEDDQRMIELCLASLWHWTQRDDCSDTNMSIGYWQASRVYATVGLAGEARRYATLCLEASNRPNVPTFYAGYAYEALARAAQVAGHLDAAREQLAASRTIAHGLTDPSHKEQLLADLDALAQRLGAT